MSPQRISGTMKGKRVLVDTSVWIAYFRSTSPELSQRVDELMSDAEICVPRIVIAELIQGSKSTREISTIESFADAFTIVDQTEHTWISAGRLAYDLKKKGKTVNLADCYIAAIAREQGCEVYTLDQHFKDIQGITGIPLS
jgi:predicted nucleic acid-binding protein